jgi:hypothetical protein
LHTTPPAEPIPWDLTTAHGLVVPLLKYLWTHREARKRDLAGPVWPVGKEPGDTALDGLLKRARAWLNRPKQRERAIGKLRRKDGKVYLTVIPAPAVAA